MVEISQEARDIMRTNSMSYGGKRGGRNAVPVDMQSAQVTPPSGFFGRMRQTLDIWMGPGQPLPIAAPDGTPPRAWDYPLFYNYSVQPDAAKAREAGVTMYQLKMLAQQTHVALAKEKAKNKQRKKSWIFGLEKQPNERPHEAMKRATKDPRIKIVSDFFRLPDGENELPEWLGMNLENILTVGVTSIVPWRTKGGAPYRLEVYDPATIVPKIDSGGRRPIGIDPATGEKAVAFQQYIKGVPYQNFSDDDMLWYGPNPEPGKTYPVGPTEKLLVYTNTALRKDLQRLLQYTDGNIPTGFIPMPAGWTPKQIEDWYKNFNLFVVSIPENYAKMVPIPFAGAGARPIFPQLEAMKDSWDEPWTRIAFSYFDVPVSTLVKEMTKANASGNRSQADEEGEQYYEKVCGRLINRCIVKFFGWTDIIARTQAEIETSLDTQSQIDDRRVQRGLDQPNELRERDGLEPLQALLGKEGYYDGQGNFVTFDTALAVDAGAGASAEDSEVTGEAAETPEDEAQESAVEAVEAGKVAKASKKNSQRSASRTSTPNAHGY